MPKDVALTNEQLQKMILETQLETAQIALEQQRETNAAFKAHKEAKSRQNAQRQANLALERQSKAAIQSVCLHRQGGHPDNILKGNGPSVLSKTRMLDGRRYLIQCNRCDLKLLTPHPALQKEDPERYAREMAEYNRLSEEADSNGLAQIQGCTFDFQQNGVSVLPELR